MINSAPTKHINAARTFRRKSSRSCKKNMPSSKVTITPVCRKGATKLRLPDWYACNSVTPDTLKIKQSRIILLAVSPLKKGLSFRTACGLASKTTSAGPIKLSAVHEAVSACLPTYAHVTLANPNSSPVNNPSTTPRSSLNFEAVLGRFVSSATPLKISSAPTTCQICKNSLKKSTPILITQTACVANKIGNAEASTSCNV